jgi:integrase-like protein
MLNRMFNRMFNRMLSRLFRRVLLTISDQHQMGAHVMATDSAARVVLESWRVEYNERRPHSALGYRTSSEYAGSRANRFDGGCAPPNPAPLAAAGVRGELRINVTRWQSKTLRNPQNFSYEVSHLRGHGTDRADRFANTET